MFQSGCDYSRANYPAVAPDAAAPVSRPRPSGVKPVPPPKPFPRPPSVRPPALPPSHVVNRRRPLTCVNDMAQNPLYMCRLSVFFLFLHLHSDTLATSLESTKEFGFHLSMRRPSNPGRLNDEIAHRRLDDPYLDPAPCEWQLDRDTKPLRIREMERKRKEKVSGMPVANFRIFFLSVFKTRVGERS